MGVQLLYKVILVSTAQQSNSAVGIHISPLFWISFPFRSPQSTEQSSLCCTIGFHQFSILCILSIVYIGQSQFPNYFHPLFPSWYSCICFLHLSFSFCFVNKFICTAFKKDCAYEQYDICLTSLSVTISRSICVTAGGIILFLWMSKIGLYRPKFGSEHLSIS